MCKKFVAEYGSAYVEKCYYARVNEPPKKILVYDGSCATCRVMKSAADKTVSNYVFLDATSDEGKKLVAEKKLDIEKSAYLIDKDRTVSHSEMALEVMHDIRFIGPVLSRIARILPHTWRDSTYEWLVRHRIK